MWTPTIVPSGITTRSGAGIVLKVFERVHQNPQVHCNRVRRLRDSGNDESICPTGLHQASPRHLRAGDEPEWSRGRNRVLINRAANNDPLLDEDEAKWVGMDMNIRWGEFMNALAHACRQYLTNFTTQHLFRFRSQRHQKKSAPIGGDFITEFINDVMKEGDHELEII